MIKKIVRDNGIINPIFRNVIKVFNRFVKSMSRLTSLYRVYGKVNLNMCDVPFKIYSASDDHIANEIFYKQSYEDEEFLLVKKLTQRSHYFIDVGANTGIFSIFAATANKDLKVLSYEPHPSNYQRLLKNIQINSLSSIIAFPNAVGQHEEVIQFTLPASGGLSTTASVNESFASNFSKILYQKIDVKQITLDDALQPYTISPCDLLKVDVEYYELEVLKGAQMTLSTKRPLLLIEILHYESLVEQFPDMKGKINQNHATEIQNFLFSLGYFPFALESNGIRHITSVLDSPGKRNFLFMPRKINENFISFNDIGGLILS